MGAVHDLGALVISLRHKGHTMADITGMVMNRHLKIMFFIIVFLALLIVIAIFGLVIAVLFDLYPQAVFPVWMEIPIAIVLGRAILRGRISLTTATALAVAAMYVTVVIGHYMPLQMPAIAGIPATGVWTLLLLVYAYIASTLPVTTLLQPRDYINAWQLFIALGLLVLGVFAAAPEMVAPAFHLSPEGAPPWMPFLFITIACGAISGFHCLVSSGTSSKQVASEPDARFVGYGSMLTEGFLATIVLIACGAGLALAYTAADGTVLTGSDAFAAHYGSWMASSGLASKVAAFVVGAANMISALGLPRELAIVVMGVFVASFAGTTLDTATRLQRYVISELATDLRIEPLTRRHPATLLAVVTAAALAFYNGAGGKGALLLWPLFGSMNQLLAGLALIVVTYWLKQQARNYLVTLLPSLAIFVCTAWALAHTLGSLYDRRQRAEPGHRRHRPGPADLAHRRGRGPDGAPGAGGGAGLGRLRPRLPSVPAPVSRILPGLPSRAAERLARARPAAAGRYRVGHPRRPAAAGRGGSAAPRRPGDRPRRRRSRRPGRAGREGALHGPGPSGGGLLPLRSRARRAGGPSRHHRLQGPGRVGPAPSARAAAYGSPRSRALPLPPARALRPRRRGPGRRGPRRARRSGLRRTRCASSSSRSTWHACAPTWTGWSSSTRPPGPWPATSAPGTPAGRRPSPAPPSCSRSWPPSWGRRPSGSTPSGSSPGTP